MTPTPTTSAEGERPVDLDGLEALANAATQGEWQLDELTVFVSGECYVEVTADASPEDAAFIAAANPATVLALIQEAREYRRIASALAWLAERGWWSPSRRTPSEVCAYATEFGWTEDQGRTL